MSLLRTRLSEPVMQVIVFTLTLTCYWTPGSRSSHCSSSLPLHLTLVKVMASVWRSSTAALTSHWKKSYTFSPQPATSVLREFSSKLTHHLGGCFTGIRYWIQECALQRWRLSLRIIMSQVLALVLSVCPFGTAPVYSSQGQDCLLATQKPRILWVPWPETFLTSSLIYIFWHYQIN